MKHTPKRRPKCHYCHNPLYVKGGKCKNCGAPATPLEPTKSAEGCKVRDEIKHRVRKDSPANFMKS